MQIFDYQTSATPETQKSKVNQKLKKLSKRNKLKLMKQWLKPIYRIYDSSIKEIPVDGTKGSKTLEDTPK